MTKVKLCGLRNEQDILCVNELMPEYIGFVLWEKSKRYVTRSEAESLRKKLNPEIKVVGVFVNEDIHRVEALIADGIIDIAQLHGDEDEAYIRRLKQDTQHEVIKAFKLSGSDDASIYREDVLDQIHNSSADMVLLDSGMGSGKGFDWSILKSVRRPYFLAGGLTPESVGTAVKELNPYAVDASSSLETDGKKDPLKMRSFVDEVRKAV